MQNASGQFIEILQNQPLETGSLTRAASKAVRINQGLARNQLKVATERQVRKYQRCKPSLKECRTSKERTIR
jgi:hypothetical protein